MWLLFGVYFFDLVVVQQRLSDPLAMGLIIASHGCSPTRENKVVAQLNVLGFLYFLFHLWSNHRDRRIKITKNQRMHYTYG